MNAKLIAVSTLAAATLLASSDALASHQSGPYWIEVLVDGAPTQVYQSGGESYVAGTFGSSYRIRVHNTSGNRIEAVVAVDGRDVITGQSVSPGRHRGYIVPAYGSTDIEGFRSTDASVATFRFTTVPNSYAWRTGTSWGIGTIRVWVFDEAAPPPVYYGPIVPYGAMDESAPSAMGGARQRSGTGAESSAAPQTMGTQYGEQRWSPVGYTSFNRASSSATAVLGIRYNSYDVLAAAGIVGPTWYPTYQPVYYPSYPYNYPYRTYAPPPPGYPY